jgi:putative chitinase
VSDFLRAILALLIRLFGGSAPVAPPAEAQGVPVHVANEPNWIAILRAAGMVRPEAWAQHIAEPARRYGINNQRRAAAFAATIAHESANGTRMAESLNYSPAGLRATWPARFSQADADMLGRRLGQEADQRAIAERAYGGRMGNGPEGTGDGFRFRGRGLIQITGRDAYRRAGAATGLRLEEHPENAEAEAVAAEIAAWTWAEWKRCNPLADAENVQGWRRAINGGLNGLDDVQIRYARALAS